MNTTDYLKEPDKWQASSHPKLANRKPEELFAPEFVERYKRLHEDIWSRVNRVHGTLHTIEELKGIPFEYVYSPNDMEFWRLVVKNFLDMTCVLLHGLIRDQLENAHTIPRFRSEIMNGPWLEDANRDLFKTTIKERGFDRTVDSIAARIREIRHHRIAHRILESPCGGANEPIESVDLDELWSLFHATHKLFGALSFGSAYVTLSGDLAPSTVGGKPKRTCLAGVLDAVLRDSYFVTQPEREAKWWSTIREHMDPDELRLMNECRKRVGLPEA